MQEPIRALTEVLAEVLMKALVTVMSQRNQRYQRGKNRKEQWETQCLLELKAPPRVRIWLLPPSQLLYWLSRYFCKRRTQMFPFKGVAVVIGGPCIAELLSYLVALDRCSSILRSDILSFFSGRSYTSASVYGIVDLFILPEIHTTTIYDIYKNAFLTDRQLLASCGRNARLVRTNPIFYTPSQPAVRLWSSSS